MMLNFERLKNAWVGIMTLSFREAVLLPLSGYYKPDNKYWNEHNKKAFWYRLIALSTAMMISISAFAIYKNQSPWILVAERYKSARQGLPMLTKDFPLRLIAYPRLWATKFNAIDSKQLLGALDNESTKASIAGLIKESNNVHFSELGGVLFLKEGRLVFYVLDNPNRLIALDINQALKKDDAFVFTKYAQYKELIQEKFGYEPAIWKIKAILDKNPKNIIFTRKILDLFAFLCIFDHQVDFDQLLELFYEGSKGTYLGNFHVHQFGDKPSHNDLEASTVEDKFVIADIAGYQTTFYWLKGGKIYQEKIIEKKH